MGLKPKRGTEWTKELVDIVSMDAAAAVSLGCDEKLDVVLYNVHFTDVS